MKERERQPIIIRPEDILTPQEAAILQKADRGELPCPQCGQPLIGQKLVSDLYEGVLLICTDGKACGYQEY